MVPPPANQEPAPAQAQQGQNQGPYTLTVSTSRNGAQGNAVTYPSVAASPNRKEPAFRGQPSQRRDPGQRPAVRRVTTGGPEIGRPAPANVPSGIPDTAVVDVTSGMVTRVRNSADAPSREDRVAAAHRPDHTAGASHDPYDRLKEKTAAFFRTPPSRSVSAPPFGPSCW
jgi:hypothetical protein